MKLKKCQGCGEEKPLTEYYKDKYSADKHQARCKVCHQKRWGHYGKLEGVKAARYDKQAQRKFGLRPGELKYIRLAQGNVCLVCGKDGKLEVDHDHEVGRVRGLLCGNCNKALGLIHDKPDTAFRLWAYLEGLI